MPSEATLVSLSSELVITLLKSDFMRWEIEVLVGLHRMNSWLHIRSCPFFKIWFPAILLVLPELCSMETRSLVGHERMDTKSLSGSERKGHKRKLADTSLGLLAIDGPNNALIVDVRGQVGILKTCLSWKEADRTAARRAAHALAELAKHGNSLRSLELLFPCSFLCLQSAFYWCIFLGESLFGTQVTSALTFPGVCASVVLPSFNDFVCKCFRRARWHHRGWRSSWCAGTASLCTCCRGRLYCLWTWGWERCSVCSGTPCC